MSSFWGQLCVGDRKIGYVHQTFRAEPARDRYRCEWRTALALRRGGVDLEFQEDAGVWENGAGLVQRYRYRARSFAGGQGMTDVAVEGMVEGTRLRLVSKGYTRQAAFDPAAKGPWFVGRRLTAAQRRGDHGPDEILVFCPELARGIRVRVELGAMEMVRLRRHRRRLRRVTQTTELRPRHPELSWIDADGVAVVRQFDMPLLGPARIVKCSKADALRPSDPVEIMTAAALAAPVSIPAPRGVRRARFRLRCAADAVPGFCVGEGQAVTRLDGGLVEVLVGREHSASPAGTETFQCPVAPARDLDVYLRPTPFLEADAPLIRRMATAAAADVRDAAQLAGRLERYVRNTIRRKTLDMGFASALETARTLRGDCSEHAVLVAALARALGLPSRLVVGLAYVPQAPLGAHAETGAFVFHVWAELLTAPQAWHPVDPALGGFDATHIALTKNALDTVAPLIDLCHPVMEMIDSLRIEAVEILDPPLPAPRPAPA